MTEKNIAKTIYIEILIKNILLAVLFLVFLLPQISYEFEVLEKSQQGGVLSVLGFLMAGGIIGAFELSYSKTNLRSALQRYLAHSCKFLLYLATCILIWIGYKSMAISGEYYNDWILITSLLIICSLVIFDIWDAVTAVEAQK